MADQDPNPNAGGDVSDSHADHLAAAKAAFGDNADAGKSGDDQAAAAAKAAAADAKAKAGADAAAAAAAAAKPKFPSIIKGKEQPAGDKKADQTPPPEAPEFD
jgi:hypothetical protein